ncbi:hypothetical protein Thiosp_01143 [Thiorhodovibrio litoralis]|nr:hypothetical protein [Thiorhodovibrio winogradskyi]WPL11408.1 hypothetical protein Thiosp_01143 [Thiorhodovibrio litoralis]
MGRLRFDVRVLKKNVNDSILYYPHIEIRNERWLKAALLLWDNVFRIVPSGYSPRDSIEIIKACDNGLVRPIALEPEDLSGVTRDFQDLLEGIQYKPAGLEHDEYSYLHPDKIDSVLYPSLEKYAVGESEEGFLLLPREVVRGYMFFLSTEVSRRRQLSRCTDDQYSFAVSSYFSESANFDDFLSDTEANGFYSALVFNDLLPFDVDSIPMDRIVKASAHSKDERNTFKLELERFSDQLHKCESIKHGKDILNDFKRDLEKAKANLKASQGFLNKDDVGSMFTMGVPTSAGVYGALLGATGDPFNLYEIGASMLVGAIAAYIDYRKAKSARNNPAGAAYLIALERQFGAGGRYPAFDRYLEEFIND